MRIISGYTYTDHTADACLIAWSPTIEGLFRQSANGLINLMIDKESILPLLSKHFDITDNPLENLLIRFLSKIKDLVQFEGFAIKELDSIEISGDKLNARVIGEPLDTQKHILRNEIKRITYHNFLLKRYNNAFWKTRVVIDL